MSLEKGAGKQSYQLGLLTFVHFLADCANNAVPGFLPVAMAYFTLDLSYGVGLLSVLGIGCNLLQIPLSKLGGKSRSPVWIITGLIHCRNPSLTASPWHWKWDIPISQPN